MSFMLGSVPPLKEKEKIFLFLFKKNELLVKKSGDRHIIPDSMDLNNLCDKYSETLYIGSLDGYSCYTANYLDEKPLEGMELLTLRQLFGSLDKTFVQPAFRAIQILSWDDTHNFCGVCGTPTFKKAEEHAKICPSCGFISYPRLSPAIIVAITKEDKLLLARNKNNYTGLYSVLAGFVEAGETLEECVRREIKEEVGIEVKNIKYFGSQSWPFPNQLMLGFTAEHASGEIQIGEDEIADAKWFSVLEIPKVQGPANISISRSLINWFIDNNK